MLYLLIFLLTTLPTYTDKHCFLLRFLAQHFEKNKNLRGDNSIKWGYTKEHI